MAIEHDTLFLDSLNSTATSSSASLDLDHPFESTSSSPLSPSLTKLNARAIAFIPRSSSSPSLSSAMLAKSSSSPSLATMSHPNSSRANLNRPESRIGPGSGPVNGQTVLHLIATPSAAFHQITTHVPVQNYIYASQLPVQYPYAGGIGRGFVDHGGMPAVVVIGADSERLSDEACQKIINQVSINLSVNITSNYYKWYVDILRHTFSTLVLLLSIN